MSTASVPNTFANAVTATGLQLDQNYNTIVAYLNEPLNRNNWAVDSGTTNTIVLTFSPPVSAYSAGLEITFKAAVTNTGAAVINANALGNQNFVQPGGGALASGQIQANGVYKAAHNGSAFVYIGQNVLAAAKADMQTATSAVTFVSPAQTQNHPGVAKAWATTRVTAGTPTLVANYNVASVARGGTGTTTILFSTNFADTNYVCIGSIFRTAVGAIGVEYIALTVSSVVQVTFLTSDGSPSDVYNGFYFAAFGNQ